MKLVTGSVLRELDRLTIEAGTPGAALMARAGAGAVEELLAFAGRLAARHARRFLVVTGKGNNGGDGHVMARLLAQAGRQTVVCSTCPKADLLGDARHYAERLPDTVAFKVIDRLPADQLTTGTVIVDCLLGTGISGAVREPYATIIGQINDSGLPVVAVDLPSGVDADTGDVANAAIRADLTVTMGLPKVGLLYGAGAELSGMIRVVDIGLAAPAVAAAPAADEVLTAADLRPLLPRLSRTVHKGAMGRVLIVGGCGRFPGAPMLAGAGALRVGGGLVTVAYPASIGALLTPRENALIRLPLADADTGSHHAEAAAAELPALLQTQDVLALGPGLGQAPEALRLVQRLLESELPAVVDADALRVAASDPSALTRSAATVLTPHPGELKRLLTAIGRADILELDRVGQATATAAALGAVVVLKGSRSIVAGPRGEAWINTSGSPALASGGTGDVLSGMIAALLCQLPVLEAVKLGVFLHGLAAELAGGASRSLIADDLPGLLPQALAELSPLA